MKLLSYLMVRFGITRVNIFLKLQMWKYFKWLTKPKLFNIGFVKLGHRFKNTKISKNYHIKRTSFQIHSNKIYSKNDNILIVIEFRRNFEISLSKFYRKILVLAMVNLYILMEI